MDDTQNSMWAVFIWTIVLSTKEIVPPFDRVDYVLGEITLKDKYLKTWGTKAWLNTSNESEKIGFM